MHNKIWFAEPCMVVPTAVHEPLHACCLQISSVYPLAIIHVLGNVLTNVSLGKVAVSFTHTVKVRQQGDCLAGACSDEVHTNIMSGLYLLISLACRV